MKLRQARKIRKRERDDEIWYRQSTLATANARCTIDRYMMSPRMTESFRLMAAAAKACGAALDGMSHPFAMLTGIPIMTRPRGGFMKAPTA